VRRIGPYEVIREVARGGFGAVYEARGPAGERVAIKVLLAYDDPREVERFLREGKVVQALGHPGIVRVHQVGVDPKPYLVMDFVGGESLQERLLRGGPWQGSTAARLIRELCDAVAAANEQGVLHRDLKPHNVLLAGRKALLTDFGIARVAGARDLTLSGEMLGTPGYMAPEQIHGDRASFGAHTDVYGLGATLYALLTGRPPFQGDSVLATLDRAVREDPAPPSTLCSVDAGLEQICLRALAREPGERYPDAPALADALLAWEGASRGGSRGPGRLIAGAALAGLVVAGAWWASGLAPSPRQGAGSARTPEPSASSGADPGEAESATRRLADLEPRLEGYDPRTLEALAALGAELKGSDARRCRLWRTILLALEKKAGPARELFEDTKRGEHGPAHDAFYEFARGQLLIAEGAGLEQARERFQRAWEVDPRPAYAAWCGLLSSGRARRSWLERAQDLERDHPDVVALEVRVARAQDDLESGGRAKVVQRIAEALARHPAHPTLLYEGVYDAYVHAQRLRQGGEQAAAQKLERLAIGWAEDLERFWPLSPGALRQVGWLFGRRGIDAERSKRPALFAQGVERLSRALERAPGLESVRRERMSLYGRLSRFELALQDYEALGGGERGDEKTLHGMTTMVCAMLKEERLTWAQADAPTLLAAFKAAKEAWVQLERRFPQAWQRLARRTRQGQNAGSRMVQLGIDLARLLGMNRRWADSETVFASCAERISESQATELEALLLLRRGRNTLERAYYGGRDAKTWVKRGLVDLRRSHELGQPSAGLVFELWRAVLQAPGKLQLERGELSAADQALVQVAQAADLGDRPAKAAALARAAAAWPYDPLLRYLAILELSRQSRHEAALELWRGAPEEQEREHPLLLLAAAVVQQDLTGLNEDTTAGRRALELFDRAIEVYPDYVNARRHRMGFYIAQGRREAAQRELEWLRARDDPQSLERLVQALEAASKR